MIIINMGMVSRCCPKFITDDSCWSSCLHVFVGEGGGAHMLSEIPGGIINCGLKYTVH